MKLRAGNLACLHCAFTTSIHPISLRILPAVNKEELAGTAISQL